MASSHLALFDETGAPSRAVPRSAPFVPATGAATEPIPAAQFFQNIRYVTLKVTNGCNLKCSYCNVEADDPKTPRMSLDVFKRIADVYIPNAKSPSLGLEFHGGEPLLLSDDWYREAVGYAKRLGDKHGKSLQHPMQTNGTKLTDERYTFLRGLGIDIGFSFDGPPHINDRFRMAGLRVERVIRRLTEQNESFGMITVLSRGNCNHMYEVMEYFRDLGVRDFRVNFMQPQGLGTHYEILSGEEMFEGMRAVFDHMADTRCSVMEADVQLAVMRYMMGRQKNPGLSCWEYQCQAGRSYVAVNHMGEVYSCGTDMSQHQLGHIDEDFDSATVKGTLKRLHKKDRFYTRCFDCSAKRICNMSCPTSDFNDLAYREAECKYTRLLFAYFDRHSDRVRAVADEVARRRPRGGRARQ